MEDSAQIEGADGADSDVKGKAIDEASGTTIDLRVEKCTSQVIGPTGVK